MKQIVHIPNVVLASPAGEVVKFDKKLHDLVVTMKHTLSATRNPKGVGLAAPQIGVSLRIFLTKPSEKSEVRVFINPTITEHAQELTDGVPQRENKLEGCLSIPKIWGHVRRATNLTLEYQDEEGQKHTEHFSGFLATIIQHETDHVNGILFTMRVVEQKGKLFQSVQDKDDKEVLEEITI